MIQDLYQTIKKTQPHLFTKSSSTDSTNDKQLNIDNTANYDTKDSEEIDVDDGEQEENIPLTPEMERANTIYHQAMKLINVTINRKYEA